MFVIRLLLAVLATILIALLAGGAMGLSAWQSAGFAVLAVVFLQMLVLAYVLQAGMRRMRQLSPKAAAKPGSRKKTSENLSVLPE